MTRRASAAIALALAIAGCHAAAPPGGRHVYRAWLTTATGDEIPFFLELPANCNTDRAAIVNGTERISMPCQRLGDRVLFDFIVYGTRISANVDDKGNLYGHWSHAGGNFGPDDRVQFAARPIDRLDPAIRFAAAAATPSGSDVAGIWRLDFESHEPAKAVLRMVEAGVIQGTAEVPAEYGDLRFLAGNVHGSALSLSTFDGTGAYLIRGQLQADHRLTGELVRADGSRDRFTAVRSADFDVIDPLQRVHVTSTERRLDLSALLTPRYADKPVIVELFGTWCANCNDLAPLLAELYQTHHAEGLEILSLAFELSADEHFVRERVAEYKAAHGVEWEVLVPSAPPEELLAVGPARLSPINGVPITLFFNRDRSVRAIYTGFVGPAAGASHDRATATFRRLTKEILASR